MEESVTRRVPAAFHVLVGIFVVSGFAGLVYESVWAQYLKLFLGHAAYGQTMVLCIFMGGLALGAWLAARYSHRITQPLLAYAAIEAAVGLFGLAFHGLFTRAMDLHYEHILPITSDPILVAATKGLFGILLIGPQTVLLGATFPLMTAGILRLLPDGPGRKISLLYFSNSIGAAAGVLASVFLFIPWAGLPGAILSAAILNIVVALGAWLVVRSGALRPADTPASVEVTRPPQVHASGTQLAAWIVLAAAAFTGMASFIYEVVWIRMLTLVLGASTHSFELMLSAFITGLALGSLAIRRRIDGIAQPYRVLGYIQIVMGLFALASLWVYSESFHWMAALMTAIARTEQGYTLFLLASHAICFAIMLPATFTAGMTLPLITHALLRQGYGERAVGAVYSINTLGSIAGVLFALHVAIPLTGLKATLVIGGGLDMLVGIALLLVTAVRVAAWRPALAATVSGIGLAGAAWGVTLDPYKLNSAVYRYDRAALDTSHQFLYSGDGRTASIALYRTSDGGRILATNGKPDGRIDPSTKPPSSDDVTTTLLAALGMAYHPEARSAANIGLGTGVTTRTLLRSPRLQRVDTLEIEPKVVEAVQLLRDEVETVFTDPRGRIIVDDAKSYFSTHRAKYDLIVAEPSNPWVSGVASLFTAEFYRRMTDHLSDRGVLVQWLQAYEIDLECIASVMLALGQAFANYTLYTTNGNDILVVAWKGTEAREPDSRVLDWPELRADWRRTGVESIADLEARRIGGRAVMHPFFRSYTVPVNSDYFPYLDTRAARTRFLRRNADALMTLRTTALPLTEMLESRESPYEQTRIAERTFVHRSVAVRDALAAYRFLNGDGKLDGLLPGTRQELATFATFCGGSPLFGPGEGLSALIGISISVAPYLTQNESRKALSSLLKGNCMARLGQDAPVVRELIERIVERDGAGMHSTGRQLLAQLSNSADRRLLGLALDSAMLGAIVNGQPGEAHKLWAQYGKQLRGSGPIPVENRLLLSVAEVRMARR